MAKATYAVGDRLRIINTLKFGEKYGDHHVGASTIKSRGKVVTVKQVSEEGNYWVDEVPYEMVTDSMVAYREEDLVSDRSWQEFRDSGLLWFINTVLHTFGWAIVVDVDKEGNATAGYPSRVKFRGFSEKINTEGYEKVTKYMRDNVVELVKDSTQ